jgi:hypothetical protein
VTSPPPRGPGEQAPAVRESKLAIARRRWGAARVIRGTPSGLVVLRHPHRPSIVPDPPAA